MGSTNEITSTQKQTVQSFTINSRGPKHTHIYDRYVKMRCEIRNFGKLQKKKKKRDSNFKKISQFSV